MCASRSRWALMRRDVRHDVLCLAVRRYDKMSARELFRQWGVSQRCYEEVRGSQGQYYCCHFSALQST
jgi:hypothetical protein